MRKRIGWLLLACGGVLMALAGGMQTKAEEGAPASTEETRVLFHFEKGKQGWWSFQKNVAVTLSQVAQDGADGTSGALSIFCKSAGGGGYQGVGTQFKYVMGKEADPWSKYADGHLSIWLKADRPCGVRVELRSKAAGAFVVSLGATDCWRCFQIPMSSFKKSGAPLDLRQTALDEMVVIPPADGKGRLLLVDEVALNTKPLALKTIETEMTGTVKNAAGAPVAGVDVMLNDPSGKTALVSTKTGADGAYRLAAKVEAQSYRIKEVGDDAAGKIPADLTVRAEGYPETIMPQFLTEKPAQQDVVLRKIAPALPELKVRGNRIVDPAGKEVWLQGLCIDSLEWSEGGDRILRAVAIAAGPWNSNCIRLPVHQKFWFGKGDYQHDGGESYRKLVDAAIVESLQRGAYLVLDLHVFGFPAAEHVEFWKDAATRYKNNPAVLFDLFNEPHSISWAVWRKGGDTAKDKDAHKDTNVAENNIKQAGTVSVGMQALIDAVRSTGARNIVIAGGLDWGYDLSGVMNGFALQDAADGNGIVYSTHVYPWKTNWQKALVDAAAQHPLFIGEVGCQDKPMPWQKTTEDPAVWAPDMIGLMQKHRLNWTGFSFHPGCGPRVIGDWQYTPTPYWGAYVQRALAGEQFTMQKMR